MAKKLIFILLWILLGCYCLTMIFFVESEKQSLVLGNYRIEILDSLDNEFVDKKDIVKLISNNFGSLKGKRINDINKDSIEKIIETHSCIKRAEVYNNANGVVKVKLLQRKPLFRVFSNMSFYVDEDRKIMPFSSKFTSRVCVVTGNINEKMAKGILFDFCKYTNTNIFWSSFIEQIHINQQNDVILIPKLGEFTIILGSFDNYRQKMSNLKAFLDNGNKNKIWGRYKKINLKYENQVVCVK